MRIIIGQISNFILFFYSIRERHLQVTPLYTTWFSHFNNFGSSLSNHHYFLVPGAHVPIRILDPEAFTRIRAASSALLNFCSSGLSSSHIDSSSASFVPVLILSFRPVIEYAQLPRSPATKGPLGIQSVIYDSNLDGGHGGNNARGFLPSEAEIASTEEMRDDVRGEDDSKTGEVDSAYVNGQIDTTTCVESNIPICPTLRNGGPQPSINLENIDHLGMEGVSVEPCDEGIGQNIGKVSTISKKIKSPKLKPIFSPKPLNSIDASSAIGALMAQYAKDVSSSPSRILSATSSFVRHLRKAFGTVDGHPVEEVQRNAAVLCEVLNGSTRSRKRPLDECGYD